MNTFCSFELGKLYVLFSNKKDVEIELLNTLQSQFSVTIMGINFKKDSERLLLKANEIPDVKLMPKERILSVTNNKFKEEVMLVGLVGLSNDSIEQLFLSFKSIIKIKQQIKSIIMIQGDITGKIYPDYKMEDVTEFSLEQFRKLFSLTGRKIPKPPFKVKK